MAANAISVVTELQTKTSSGSGWDPTPIGSDVTYITNKRSPSNHNLEEDLILGVNKITKIQRDSETQATKKIIEYRTEEKTEDYYFIETIMYGGDTGAGNVRIDQINGELQFTLTDTVTSASVPKADIELHEGGETPGLHFTVRSKYYVDNTGLHSNGYDPDFIYDNESNKLKVSPRYQAEITTLYYQGKITDDPIPVTTKYRYEQTDSEGHHYTIESIVEGRPEPEDI